MTFKLTTYKTKNQDMKHMVNLINGTATVQSRDREGQTMSRWSKKALNQQVERSEENPEWLQQEIGKVNQASQQEGTLEDQATMNVPTRLGNIKRSGSIR